MTCYLFLSLTLLEQFIYVFTKANYRPSKKVFTQSFIYKSQLHHIFMKYNYIILLPYCAIYKQCSKIKTKIQCILFYLFDICMHFMSQIIHYNYVKFCWANHQTKNDSICNN